MNLSALKKDPPQILGRHKQKVSRIFTVEELHLQFSNGTKAVYEKICGGSGAVMCIPFDGTHFLLSSEYACGLEGYSLGFVKGKIDAGETPEEAAVRELEEEIGLGAKRLTRLRKAMTVAPGMLELKMHVFLCRDLYPCKLTGDEPEPIDVIKVSVEEAKKLLFDVDSPLMEARSIGALALSLHEIGAI